MRYAVAVPVTKRVRPSAANAVDLLIRRGVVSVDNKCNRIPNQLDGVHARISVGQSYRRPCLSKINGIGTGNNVTTSIESYIMQSLYLEAKKVGETIE